MEGRTGGVYVPPFRKNAIHADDTGVDESHQREEWDVLKKSLNGLVNKANISNIGHIVRDLFHLNMIRGRGIFARAILRAQMTSPSFTHIFVAIVAVINSRIPDIGELVLRRTMIQFQRAYKRNDKAALTSSCTLIAHMVNQRLAGEMVALQVVTLFLDKLTDDSIDVCCGFIRACGQALTQATPKGVHFVFERLRAILHEGQISRKTQYVIEELFELRRLKFNASPAIPEQLDLVEEEDQVTHELDLSEPQDPQEELNMFTAVSAEQFIAENEQWLELSREIIGEEDVADEESHDQEEPDQPQEEVKEDVVIKDHTGNDDVILRRTIYLAIMSSINYEECVHKILRLDIPQGKEREVAAILIDACAHERTFNRFFALQAERLCRLKHAYRNEFEQSFGLMYSTAHRLETNKIRNVAKFFGHLLISDSISWKVLQDVVLTEEATTSSTRIFIKILFQDMSESLGAPQLKEKLQKPDYAEFLRGIFPHEDSACIRFSINFFTAIGLGSLTQGSRQLLARLMAEEESSEESDDQSSAGSESPVERRRSRSRSRDDVIRRRR